jgi:signal transduction histidine kinase
VIEFMARRKDGSTFPAEASVAAVPLEAGWHRLWVLRDVSVRKEAEEALVRAYDEVEKRVQTRTAELARANDALHAEIGERKLAEEQLRQAAGQLQQQAAQLAEADRRKDEFVSVLAHELRNPLAPIANAVELLKRRAGPPDPTVQWAEGVIGRQVAHLTRLVDDLLDLARITRGQIELKKEPVALADLVTRTVETARPAIEARHQTLTVTLAPQPLVLDADPVRLTQVIDNLLDNAVKYTPEGGSIALSAEQAGREVVIRVRDSGIGIAPERLPRIFEPFGQPGTPVEQARSGGLGLGLSLTRRLVEMHGGSIEARSAGVEQGSEFIVRLPQAGEPPAEISVSEKQTREAPSRSRRVLLVEDNPDVADSFARLLRMLGHEVRVATNGMAGLAEARRFDPEVAFIDIGLPDIDGYEVARGLRAEHPGGIRLVAVTGYGQEADRRRAREAGFEHHLLKPAKPETLEKMLAA